MKLKKIASLMLAGVMAVSMLTACGGNTINNNGGEGEGEGEGTTASGYSVTFGEKVEKLSSQVKGMNNVTFADNATDQAALADALNNAGAMDILWSTMSSTVNQVPMTSITSDFEDAAKLNRLGFDNGSGLIFNGTSTINRTTKVGNVYYVDGTVAMDKVLDQLAEKLDSYIEGLQKTGTVTSSDGTATYDFKYTISVSVVNKTSDVIDWYNGSVNVIAVTVTRTATAD